MDMALLNNKKSIKHMAKYLYGASVQGIQSFIFKTNKLSEIVGASELVEQICNNAFFEKIGKDSNDSNIILAAAGNIKYVFDQREDCEKCVLEFPKKIMEMAPGITISQAVVEVVNPSDLGEEIQTLEQRLRVQRNIVDSPTEIGFMGLERSRRTGGVSVEHRGDDYIDSATAAKIKNKDHLSLFKKLSGMNDLKTTHLALDIENITSSGQNSWIAVIHADGNGLGNIIQNKGSELTQNREFHAFSKAIEAATTGAAKTAFERVIPKIDTVSHYPIRPVLIGGDDLTVIIRADLALDFTREFIKEFELKSKEEFKNLKTTGLEEGLSCCAGIAFVKQSYPLHYAMHLSEDLCKDAKKMVKANLGDNELPKSALSFYKVQDSFVKDLKSLKESTLTTAEGRNFYYGPYTLEALNKLDEKLDYLKEYASGKNAGKSTGKLRQVVSELYKDESTGSFMLERIKHIDKKFFNALELEDELKITNGHKSQLLDLITLHGFNYGNKQN